MRAPGDRTAYVLCLHCALRGCMPFFPFYAIHLPAMAVGQHGVDGCPEECQPGHYSSRWGTRTTFHVNIEAWKIFAHGPVSDVQNQHTRLAVAIPVSDDLAPPSHGKALAIA